MPAPIVNLIPQARRQRRLCMRRGRFWAAAGLVYAGLGAALGIGMHTMGRGSGRALGGDLDQVNARLAELDRTTASLKQDLTQATAERDTAIALRSAPDWSDLLVLLRGVSADDTDVHEIRVEAAKPGALQQANGKTTPAATAAITPSEFTLTFRGSCGGVEQVTRIVQRFQQVGLFEDVKLISSRRESIGTDERVVFELACAMHERPPKAAK